MNYSGRPVFTWAIDWSAAINRSISYDLRETSLGFGAEFFVATQTDTAQGWNFSLDFTSYADIAAIEAFTAALYGRVNGFWLPVPFEAMNIVGAVDATHFNIADSGLTAAWQDRPDIYLQFTNADGSNPQFCAITSVADNGNGTEKVTVGTALNPAPAPGMIVRRLHYVRQMEDVEKGTFVAEGWLTRSFSVIELPLEYAAVETGRQPIYLYHFSAPAPTAMDWYYTSFAVDVYSAGNKYLAFPMTHGQLQQTARGDKEEVQINAKADPTHPFSLFFPAPFPATMDVEILSCLLGTPDTTTTLFSGIIRTIEDNGTQYSAKCASALYLLDRKLPRMLIQPTCNYALFDPQTCTILRAAFEITVILTAIDNDLVNGPNVTVELAYPDVFPARTSTANWFMGGIFETGFASSYEPRTITSSTWDSVHSLLTLGLNMPLWKAVVGQYVQITAGCDGSVNACTNKFNNYPRFGGHPFVPQRNLTLEAFDDLPISQGGKK